LRDTSDVPALLVSSGATAKREKRFVLRTHAIASFPLIFPPCDSSAQPYLARHRHAAQHLHHSQYSTSTHPVLPSNRRNPQFLLYTSHRQVQPSNLRLRLHTWNHAHKLPASCAVRSQKARPSLTIPQPETTFAKPNSRTSSSTSCGESRIDVSNHSILLPTVTLPGSPYH
jgi:hypothetical protein